MEMQI